MLKIFLMIELKEFLNFCLNTHLQENSAYFNKMKINHIVIKRSKESLDLLNFYLLERLALFKQMVYYLAAQVKNIIEDKIL